tara:strand:+ start:669 stop:797 length:129 start_codon:yes stop_codon:yes gene_type:complete
MKQEYTHVNTGYEDIIYDQDGRAYVYSPQTTPNTKVNDEVPF